MVGNPKLNVTVKKSSVKDISTYRSDLTEKLFYTQEGK